MGNDTDTPYINLLQKPSACCGGNTPNKLHTAWPVVGIQSESIQTWCNPCST
eukprot:c35367_g1_i1 orf=3-155(-)